MFGPGSKVLVMLHYGQAESPIIAARWQFNRLAGQKGSGGHETVGCSEPWDFSSYNISVTDRFVNVALCDTEGVAQ
jgi:hypothetical protein